MMKRYLRSACMLVLEALDSFSLPTLLIHRAFTFGGQLK